VDDGARDHVPVLEATVVELLGAGGTVVDMTVGAGGHAEALLESGVERVIGLDRDPRAVELAAERLARFGPRARLEVGRFSEAPEVPPGSVQGVLYDLGVSSMQLDQPERGFGYRSDGPLDMRMGGDGPTASDLVNTLPEEELARIIFELGEERRSRRIARAIVRARARARIETTAELARVVSGAAGRRPGGPHPARRTFQALRIAVNRELEELATSLPRAAGFLAPGGRVVAIAYHSLEDRIVKRFLVTEPTLRVLTRKPVRPSREEVSRNPRARSARLRAAAKEAA
jgi:16S rRNA (cytosine1402-N4)-methyltransferase